MPPLNVHIDAIEYVETVPQVTTSPLDGTPVTADVVCDCIRVTFTAGNVAGHWLYFKPEAIADRMHGYGLDDETHAVEALVRERVFDWAPHLKPPDPTNRVDVNGGIDARIGVAWGNGVQPAAAALLKGAHAERIAAARDRITAKPTPPEAV